MVHPCSLRSPWTNISTRESGRPDIKDTPARELIGDIEHLGYEASHFEGINEVMGGRGGREEAVWVSFK